MILNGILVKIFLSLYFRFRILSMAILGCACGIPLVLTASTLMVWLTEIGIDKTSIGLFASIGVPYSLKFLWAPVLDYVNIPYLTNQLGRRRSWLLCSQFLLCITLILMAFSSPEENLWYTAFLSFMVAFFSATQDICVDAYRIELLSKEEQGPGISAYIIGYRIGMLMAGAGSLFLAEIFDWSIVYTIMVCILASCICLVFFIEEPEYMPQKLFSVSSFMRRKEVAMAIIIQKRVIAPFKDFMTKESWLLILIFIMLFKLGDAFSGHMANTFYIEMGFSKREIAAIVKTYGLFATIFGSIVGGIMLSRLGIKKSIYMCGFLQFFSNILYIVQYYAGDDIMVLAATISVENFISGLSNPVLLTYLGSLCTNSLYTATQYSLMSSIISLGRTFFSSASGLVVDKYDWVIFFSVSASLCIPGILVYWFINYKRTNFKV